MSIDRRVKGERPVFVAGDAQANLNRLLAMVSALAAEVAVLRDRQRTLEKLLERRAQLGATDVEEFEPDAGDLAERIEWQAAFIRRVYAILEREAEEAAAPKEPG